MVASERSIEVKRRLRYGQKTSSVQERRDTGQAAAAKSRVIRLPGGHSAIAIAYGCGSPYYPCHRPQCDSLNRPARSERGATMVFQPVIRLRIWQRETGSGARKSLHCRMQY